MPCLLQVRGTGGGSSLVIPGAPGMLRGFAAAWCVLLATMGRVGARAGWRSSPLVAQCSPCFLPSPATYMLTGSALNALAVLANTALLLDVVDAGAYGVVLFCCAAYSWSATCPACEHFEYFL